MARAAAVQAARQAFEDREAAKIRKLERAQDRKRERKEQQELDPPQVLKRAHLPDFSFREPRGSSSEKAARSEHSGRRSQDLFEGTDPGSSEQGNGSSKLKSPKSAWLLFLIWLRTRIFKMGKKIKKQKKVG
jgi:hypothetical protein